MNYKQLMEKKKVEIAKNTLKEKRSPKFIGNNKLINI